MRTKRRIRSRLPTTLNCASAMAEDGAPAARRSSRHLQAIHCASAVLPVASVSLNTAASIDILAPTILLQNSRKDNFKILWADASLPVSVIDIEGDCTERHSDQSVPGELPQQVPLQRLCAAMLPADQDT